MRFPETFCFQLTVEEVIKLRSQFVTSSLRNEIVHGGIRYLPYVLTDNEYRIARNYWKILKNRLKKERNETVTNCNRLKLLL